MFKLLAARSWPVTTKSDESDVLLTSIEQDTVEDFSEPPDDELATSEECRLPRSSRSGLKGPNWRRPRYVLILSITSIFLFGATFLWSMHCQAMTCFIASDICLCSCYVTIESYGSDLFYASMRSRCCRALAECVFTVTENRPVYQFPRLRLWGLGLQKRAANGPGKRFKTIGLERRHSESLASNSRIRWTSCLLYRGSELTSGEA